MAGTTRPGVTVLLARARAGDEGARNDLIDRVYGELRRVADGLMRRERPGHTLSPTAVVHEAVIKMLAESALDGAKDRSYLFASAARAMREVLIDHARRRRTARRGGGQQRVPLDAVVDYFQDQGVDLVERNGRQAQAAEVPQRDWRIARAWLSNQLSGEGVG
jgi:RNA polymerase sigma-70 factor (ECF subfamily)